MSQYKRGKVKLPPFVMVRKDLLQDLEWKKLTSGAKILWLYLRNYWDYSNSKETSVTYSQMKGIMSSRAMSRALKELLDNNWIENTKKGGLFKGISKYKFIGRYKDFYYKSKVV